MHRAIKSALMFQPDARRNEEQNARAILADPYAPATLRQQAKNTILSLKPRIKSQVGK